MKTKGWISHSKNAFFFNESYIDIVPFEDHFHVGLFDLNGNLIKFLGMKSTKKNDVSKLIKTIYNDNIFIQISGNSPGETKILQINIKTNEEMIISNSTSLYNDIDVFH